MRICQPPPNRQAGRPQHVMSPKSGRTRDRHIKYGYIWRFIKYLLAPSENIQSSWWLWEFYCKYYNKRNTGTPFCHQRVIGRAFFYIVTARLGYKLSPKWKLLENIEFRYITSPFFLSFCLFTQLIEQCHCVKGHLLLVLFIEYILPPFSISWHLRIH